MAKESTSENGPVSKGFESRPIKCVLTEAEKIDRGARLAVVDSELRATREKKRAVMRGFNVEIKGFEEDQEKLDTAIRNGFEVREIQCEWFEEADKPEMFLVCVETGEEVFRRALDQHEITTRERARQKDLFGDATHSTSSAGEDADNSDDDDGFDDDAFDGDGDADGDAAH